jgi:hypothetical protein
MDSRYPKDWKEIATALKKKEQWRCYLCGIQCIAPHRMPMNGFRDSKKRVYLLQVHHWDGQPENNIASNLVCLCTSCHLKIHRRTGSLTPGQVWLFDLNPWHVIPQRAKPIIEKVVQLQIPIIKEQLKLIR